MECRNRMPFIVFFMYSPVRRAIDLWQVQPSVESQMLHSKRQLLQKAGRIAYTDIRGEEDV